MPNDDVAAVRKWLDDHRPDIRPVFDHLTRADLGSGHPYLDVEGPRARAILAWVMIGVEAGREATEREGR